VRAEGNVKRKDLIKSGSNLENKNKKFWEQLIAYFP
jgi:hypothetical protein